MKKIIVLLGLAFAFTSHVFAQKDEEQLKNEATERMKNLSIYFTENLGQWHEDVRFKANGKGATLFFTEYGTTFLLSRKKEGLNPEPPKGDFFKDKPEPPPMEYWSVKLFFEQCNNSVTYTGEDKRPWNNNYFIGNDSTKWRPNVPNWGKVNLKNVWDGIAISYFENGDEIKYSMTVEPFANPEQIVMRYDFGNEAGESGIKITELGTLEVKTPFGKFVEGVPYVFQEIDGEKSQVECSYKTVNHVDKRKTDSNVVGPNIDFIENSYSFQLGAYDPSKPLYIDPIYDFSTLDK